MKLNEVFSIFPFLKLDYWILLFYHWLISFFLYYHVLIIILFVCFLFSDFFFLNLTVKEKQLGDEERDIFWFMFFFCREMVFIHFGGYFQK